MKMPQVVTFFLGSVWWSTKPTRVHWHSDKISREFWICRWWGLLSDVRGQGVDAKGKRNILSVFFSISTPWIPISNPFSFSSPLLFSWLSLFLPKPLSLVVTYVDSLGSSSCRSWIQPPHAVQVERNEGPSHAWTGRRELCQGWTSSPDGHWGQCQPDCHPECACLLWWRPELAGSKTFQRLRRIRSGQGPPPGQGPRKVGTARRAWGVFYFSYWSDWRTG